MMITVLVCALALGVAHGSSRAPSNKNHYYLQPEQVHIAFGEKPNDIVVTWATFNDTEESVVRFWKAAQRNKTKVSGASTKFVDGGREHRFQYIHRVTLASLEFNSSYVYTVGSKYGVSVPFTFHVPPEGNQWPLRAAIYGDMGVVNAQALSFVQEEAIDGNFDIVLHIGDFAYNMDSGNGVCGDQFMQQIQSIAGLVPYMTCVGNHESAYNFSNYRARFSMPGGTESMFYSFDLGPVHFVAISTEYHYAEGSGWKELLFKQYDWLEKELASANQKDNRAVRPWVIVMGHRPMYCSNRNPDARACAHERVRTGHPQYGHGFEPLLKKHGVDLAFWAHEHSYERLWPLYNYTVYNGSLEEPYTNPGAPVHILTGSAGMYSGHDRYNGERPAWSAFRTTDYGYTRFVVHNHSHIYLEQVNVEKGGEVEDSIWLVKHSHGEFRYD